MHAGLLELVRAPEDVEHHPGGSAQAVADDIERRLGETARKGWKSPAHDAAVARNSYESGRTIRQVLTAEGILPKEEIDPLLDI